MKTKLVHYDLCMSPINSIRDPISLATFIPTGDPIAGPDLCPTFNVKSKNVGRALVARSHFNRHPLER